MLPCLLFQISYIEKQVQVSSSWAELPQERRLSLLGPRERGIKTKRGLLVQQLESPVRPQVQQWGGGHLGLPQPQGSSPQVTCPETSHQWPWVPYEADSPPSPPSALPGPAPRPAPDPWASSSVRGPSAAWPGLCDLTRQALPAVSRGGVLSSRETFWIRERFQSMHWSSTGGPACYEQVVAEGQD